MQALLSACLQVPITSFSLYILFPAGNSPQCPGGAELWASHCLLGGNSTCPTDPNHTAKITNQNHNPGNSVMRNIQHSITLSCLILPEFPIPALETSNPLRYQMLWSSTQVPSPQNYSVFPNSRGFSLPGPTAEKFPYYFQQNITCKIL